ncbi:MAG: T9SS type A sorting domain-containing protein [Saprospiraceae bacterium]
MKSTFTLVSLMLFSFSVQLKSQIVLTKDNFPREATFTDEFYFANASNIAAPTEGMNQVWDFTNLPSNDLRSRDYFEATDANFPGAFNYYQRTLSFQSFIIPNRAYEACDETGFSDYGSSSTSVSYSIQAITGGPSDTLAFPGRDVVYAQRLDYLQFPCQMGKKWTQTATENTNFVLTVQGFGLDKVPGFSKRRLTVSRDVVGEGKILLTYPDGTPTKPIDALMVKVVRTSIDSFFLGGAVAPPPLAAAFGITQGQMASDSFYVFYAPNFGMPVMDYDLVDNTIAYRPYADQTVSSKEVFSSAKFEIFPNPASSGSHLNITLEKATENGTIQIFGLNGNMVYEQRLAAGLGRAEIGLPAILNQGTYFLRIIDQEGLPTRAQKIHIK